MARNDIYDIEAATETHPPPSAALTILFDGLIRWAWQPNLRAADELGGLDQHPAQCPSVIAPYAGWQVEVDLRSIKAQMGMDILRAKSPVMIDKEIAVYLLAYNLVCALMTRAAAGACVLARSLSFKGTLQLLLAFEQQLRFGAGAGARTMTAHLLGAISQLKLSIRPGRVEPHAIKRRPKNHQLMTVPRDIARAAILRSRTARA